MQEGSGGVKFPINVGFTFWVELLKYLYEKIFSFNFVVGILFAGLCR